MHCITQHPVLLVFALSAFLSTWAHQARCCIVMLRLHACTPYVPVSNRALQLCLEDTCDLHMHLHWLCQACLTMCNRSWPGRCWSRNVTRCRHALRQNAHTMYSSASEQTMVSANMELCRECQHTFVQRCTFPTLVSKVSWLA